MKQMKNLLSLVLLITSILFTSCLEDGKITRSKDSSVKNAKVLSYSFNKGKKDKDTTTKSGILPDSISKVDKVVSVDFIEIAGETYTAALVEESEPISTKATVTQAVSQSEIYTFYAYKDSEIKRQLITDKSRTFEVPTDAATKYGMIFFSAVDGTLDPARLKIDNANGEITYTTTHEKNENLCYKIFNSTTMPPEKDIDVVFTPLFSQLYVECPITESIKLESLVIAGANRNATIKINYDSQQPQNVTIDYNGNYVNGTIYAGLVTEGNVVKTRGGYCNFIPSDYPHSRIELNFETPDGQVMTKDIFIKDKDQNPIPFERGKRYKLLVENKRLIKLEIEPAVSTLAIGQTADLKLYATYEGSTERLDITSKADWTSITPTVAEVSTAEGTKGKVTALTNGQTTIKASIPLNLTETREATATVNVDSGIKEIRIEPNPAELLKGTIKNLTAYVVYNNGGIEEEIEITEYATWASKATDIATVDDTKPNKGLVRGVKRGKAEITATFEGVTGTAEVRVFEVGVEPNPLIIRYGDGSTRELKTKITKADGTVEYPTTPTASWQFSTLGIVEEAYTTTTAIYINPVKMGATTATVSYNGETASAKVYVAKPFYEYSYYQWDAFLNIANEDKGVWQDGTPIGIFKEGGSSTCNTTNWSGPSGQNYITHVRATASCANAPTRDQAMMYIMAGYYYDKGEAEENIQPHASYTEELDGNLVYYIPHNLSTKGVWLKKWNIVKDMALDPLPNYNLTGSGLERYGGEKYRTYGRPPKSEINNYFFLPEPSYYYNGKGGSVIPFWYYLSETDWSSSAWKMEIKDEQINLVLHGGKGRDCGAIPLVGFDNTLEKLTITGESTVAKGKAITLTASLVNVNDAGVVTPITPTSWETSDASIATVSNGVVTGRVAGQVTITAKYKNIAVRTLITVTNKVTKITVITGLGSVIKGKTIGLKATATLEDGTPEDVTNRARWSSVHPTIATVNSSTGEVTGVAPGTATIKASLDGIEGSGTVIVTNNVTRMFIKCDGKELESGVVHKLYVWRDFGDDKDLKAYIKYESGEEKQLKEDEVTWESSDLTLAKVYGGLVRAERNEKADLKTVIITAKYFANPQTFTARIEFSLSDPIIEYKFNPDYVEGHAGDLVKVAIEAVRRSGLKDNADNIIGTFVTSPDPFIARGELDGRIILMAPGTTEITVTDPMRKLKAKLSVRVLEEGQM